MLHSEENFVSQREYSLKRVKPVLTEGANYCQSGNAARLMLLNINFLSQ
jgi:hypothetical protein